MSNEFPKDSFGRPIFAVGRCRGCTAWLHKRPDGTLQAHDHILHPQTCLGTGQRGYESGFVHGNEGTAHYTLEEAMRCRGCKGGLL